MSRMLENAWHDTHEKRRRKKNNGSLTHLNGFISENGLQDFLPFFFSFSIIFVLFPNTWYIGIMFALGYTHLITSASLRSHRAAEDINDKKSI